MTTYAPTYAPNPNPEVLSQRQAQVLSLIRQSRAQCGYSPTMQELADALGVSKITAYEHVRALMAKGIVTCDKFKARSLQIVESPARRLAAAVLERCEDEELVYLAHEVLGTIG